MKNIVTKKLRSQTGASITFALLLFLVCSVLCSVIIVAATTSAGRMAGIAEADQRYYSVTSASELLKELMNGKTVSVVKVTTSSATTTYTDGIAGAGDPTSNGDEVSNVYLVVGKNAEEILANVGTEDDYIIPDNQISEGEYSMNQYLITSSILNDAAYKYSSGTTIPKSSPRSLDLQTGVSDALAVTIKETLDDAGTITLTLNNSNGAPFKQEIVFGANSVKSEDVKTMDGTPTNYSSWLDPSNLEVMHNSYTVTTEKTVTEIITSTWTLSSIKTLQGSVLEE